MVSARLVQIGLRLCKAGVNEGEWDESAVGKAGRAAVGDGGSAARRKDRVDRERRPEGLAVEVLTALGERPDDCRNLTTRWGSVARNDRRDLHQVR
jgi:hypothetical protein